MITLHPNWTHVWPEPTHFVDDWVKWLKQWNAEQKGPPSQAYLYLYFGDDPLSHLCLWAVDHDGNGWTSPFFRRLNITVSDYLAEWMDNPPLEQPVRILVAIESPDCASLFKMTFA